MRERYGILALHILEELRKFEALVSSEHYLKVLTDLRQLLDYEIKQTTEKVEREKEVNAGEIGQEC